MPVTETDVTSKAVDAVPAIPASKSRGNLLMVLAGMGLLVGAVVGYRWWQYAATHESTDNAFLTAHTHQISVRVSGTVQSVLVNDNQQVKEDQLLVKLDPKDYQAALRQADAALQSAKRKADSAQANVTFATQRANAQATQATGGLGVAQAGIGTAQAGVIEASTGVQAGRAQLTQAQATLERASLDYRRYTQLKKEKAISLKDFDTTQAAYRVALASRDAAREAVNQAQARLSQARQRVTSAQASFVQSQGAGQDAEATKSQSQVSRYEYQAAISAIAQAEATLNNAQLQLSYTDITSPTNGRIGNRRVEIGQRVQPGQALMAVIQERPWVVANFKETQLQNLRTGQPVNIKIDSFSNHEFKGRIESIAPGSGAHFSLLPPDNATGNFTKIVQRIPVKIVFDSDGLKGYESLLGPGMSAEVTVQVAP
jgi:membrane fusion protein, multidrug efflux system